MTEPKITITTEKLYALIEAMKAQLDRIEAAILQSVPKKYFTLKEAAAYLGLNEKTIYNYRAQIEKMPGSRKLLFRIEALDNFLSKRRKKKR